ncbi:hypothetical protein [Sinorhizobium meliloti]|uniref:hypothetical protein n=1 Tax=Rhizobium meliloti TaxID=382 RepID=UPI000FE0A361|nr:hypothetical protein [Sinorhizobium meliloti]RVG70876.1 hypothetical protein CN222_01700 [Sinorhizobium meliloti]
MRHFRPPASSRDPRWSKAREALLVIGAVAAEDSDYAKEQNGVGFSKSDSTKGHGLARLSVVSVLSSDATYSDVIKLAARYRRQASRIAQGNLL